jgi:hypothetical protein
MVRFVSFSMYFMSDGSPAINSQFLLPENMPIFFGIENTEGMVS